VLALQNGRALCRPTRGRSFIHGALQAVSEVFDVIVVKDGAKILHGEGPRLSIIEIGEFSDIWVCEIEGNTEADRQTPLFGRGRIDHLAL